jgi:hypothetical protein
MNSLQAFGWGCAGSFAIEIVLFCQAIRQSRNNCVPAVYRRTAFILGRILLVVVAGVVAVAAGITQPMQGLAVGASAPRIILALYKLRPEIGGEGKDSEHSD